MREVTSLELDEVGGAIAPLVGRAAITVGFWVVGNYVWERMGGADTVDRAISATASAAGGAADRFAQWSGNFYSTYGMSNK